MVGGRSRDEQGAGPRADWMEERGRDPGESWQRKLKDSKLVLCIGINGRFIRISTGI